MNTYKEIVYLVLDELKLTSDDAKFTEDHIMFLMDKYRPFLLKQRYSDIKKSIPESNYQTACLDLIQVPAISGEPCEGGCYLRSREKVPFIMHIGIPRVYPKDYFQGEISYISRDRMRYVGHNKYLQNIIYATLGPDNYLYLKSSNPQYVHLESVRFTAVFLDAKDAYKIQCYSEEENSCDILDSTFPIEDNLIPPLVELIVRELTAPVYSPSDTDNNAEDDLSGLSLRKSN